MHCLQTPPGCTLLAVVGAHLTGQPLNRQLTERGARRHCDDENRTRLPAVCPGEHDAAKPGLVRAPGFRRSRHRSGSLGDSDPPIRQLCRRSPGAAGDRQRGAGGRIGRERVCLRTVRGGRGRRDHAVWRLASLSGQVDLFRMHHAPDLLPEVIQREAACNERRQPPDSVIPERVAILSHDTPAIDEH